MDENESKFKITDIVVRKKTGEGCTIVGRDNGTEKWIIQEPGNGTCRTVHDDEIEFGVDDLANEADDAERFERSPFNGA